jgi:hypothetical protein
MWLDHKFETKKEKEKSLGLSIEGLGGFFFFFPHFHCSKDCNKS